MQVGDKDQKGRKIAALAAWLILGSGIVMSVAAGGGPEAQPATAVTVSGRLIDEHAEPFREAELEAQVLSWVPGSGAQPRTLRRALTTDRDGRFSFEFVPEAHLKARFQIELSGDRFMPRQVAWSLEDVRHGTLGELKTLRRVARSARVLDPNGQPVAGARVDAVATASDHDFDNPPLRERVETDQDGRFTVHVPNQRDLGLMVQSDRGAIARRVVPAGRDRLADIPLERGAAISGRVLDRDGRPVAGCIVVLESDDDQPVRTELEIGDGLLDIRLSRVTDGEGRFRFPPLLGDVLVSLKRRGEGFRQDSDEFQKAIDPPPLVPVSLRLDAPGDTRLTLVAAPTATIRGTIRWQDGKPAAGVAIGSSLPPRRGNVYLDLGRTVSDKDGRYATRVPLPLDDLILSIDPQNGPDHQPWDARPVDPKLWRSRRQPGGLRIDHVEGDRAGLDWVIVPHGEHPGEQAEERDEDIEDVEPELIALERAIQAARQAYERARSSARTEEDRDRAEALGPGAAMVGRCLEFEAKHRGTRLGIGALHWVMRQSAMTSERAVAEARVRAIAVLGDHYVAHADVDLLINEFAHGNLPAGGEALLRKVAAESPHDYVRAAALFGLSELLIGQADLSEIFKDTEQTVAQMLPIQTTERAREFLRRQVDEARTIREARAGRDLDALRAEAQRLFDQIVTQYADARAPLRRWGGPQDIRLVDIEEDGPFRRWSIAERADMKRFQKRQLRLDQPAPILEGEDFQHRRIRLSDFAGKVVVLTVTMDTVGDREMYERCRRLLEEFQGQPVTCLSVVTTDASGGYSVRDIVREMGITWPILRDLPGDRLVHYWCQVTFPEAYIIDQNGVIRFHEWGRDSVSSLVPEKVREFLKAQARP